MMCNQEVILDTILFFIFIFYFSKNNVIFKITIEFMTLKIYHNKKHVSNERFFSIILFFIFYF